MTRSQSDPVGVLKSSLGWIVLIAVVVAWQIGATVAATPSVATPARSFAALITLVTGPALTADIVPSVVRTLGGFAIAGALGIFVGMFLALLPRVSPWFLPLLSFLRSIPPSLIVPVGIVVIGLGDRLVIAVIVFGAIWPALLSTFDGARRVEPQYRETARAMRIGTLRMVVRVLFPATLPSIMAGLRVALSVSVIMMVVAEILASTTGLGFRMSYAQQTFDVPTTYAAVILLAVFGWALDTVFVLIERRALRWHPTFQKESNV